MDKHKEEALRQLTQDFHQASQDAANLAKRFDKGAGVIPQRNLNPFKAFVSYLKNREIRRIMANANRRDAVIRYVNSNLTEKDRNRDNLQIFFWSAGFICGDYSECHLKLLILQKNQDLFSSEELVALKKIIYKTNVCESIESHPFDYAT